MLDIRVYVTGWKPVSSKPNKEFPAMIPRPKMQHSKNCHCMHRTADSLLKPCVFQFSSLKWLLPQLLTTQVLVVRGLFCVSVTGSNPT